MTNTYTPEIKRRFSHDGLRRRRIAAGLKSEQVALAIGRTKDQVRHLEAGRSVPSIPVLLALAKIFCCPLDDLFDTPGQ